MRTLYFILVLFSVCACSKSKTANKESEFYVRGNCGMCKERIEKAVESLPGVAVSKWEPNDSNLKVSYDSTLLSELDLHKAVAATGHGTKLIEMDSKAHDDLPECCKVGAHE